MTVQELFTKGLLRAFKALNASTLDKVKGKRLGVDFSIYLYLWCCHEDYAIPATTEPRYDTHYLEREIDRFHKALSEIFPFIVYVYEGKDLPLKTDKKEERLQRIRSSDAKFKELLMKHISGESLSSDDFNNMKKLRRAKSVPDEIAYGSAIRYMKQYNMTVFGAPGEAEHQLVELQNSGYIDIILTRDADLIPLGSQLVIYDLKPNYSDMIKSQMVLYNRDNIVSNASEGTLCIIRDVFPEYCSVLGTDYSRRIPHHGAAFAEQWIVKYKACVNESDKLIMLRQLEAQGVIQNRGIRGANAKAVAPRIRDEYVKLQSVQERRNYINALDNETKRSLSTVDESFIGWADNFLHAIGMYRHCPVFRITGDNVDLNNADSYDVTLEPLYNLPAGSTWKDALGFDPSDLIDLAEDGKAKYVCTLQCLLRFDGREPATFKPPTYSKEENPDVDETCVLPLYARLDFDKLPVKVQPTDILLTWLSARGIHLLAEDRNVIEAYVAKARELNTFVLEPDLQPKDNPYNWFDVLCPILLGNDFDHWNRDWTRILPLLKTIDDAEFTRIFGRGANGVRERARGLLFDGNVLMNGIECINVKSSDANDNATLILLRTKCVPSMKTTEGKSKKHMFYHVHVCIELKENGMGIIRPCPYSACSCINGAFFCSHIEAVVLGIAMAQEYLARNRLETMMNYFKSKEDPRFGQGRPVLLENYALRDIEKRMGAANKRKATKDASTPAKKTRTSPRKRKVTP